MATGLMQEQQRHLSSPVPGTFFEMSHEARLTHNPKVESPASATHALGLLDCTTRPGFLQC